MGVLNFNQLQEGMELAEDIRNFNGMILLKAGAAITKKHLNAFQMWGITEADIKGVEDDRLQSLQMENIDPHIMKQLESEMARHFDKTDANDPIIGELYRLIKIRKLKDISNEGEGFTTNSTGDSGDPPDFHASDHLRQSQ